MPDQQISSQDPLRYIHRFTDTEEYVPSLDTSEFVDIYKGEIGVNTSKESAALFIRSGTGISENDSDYIVRVGNVICSNHEPYTNPRVDKKGMFWYKQNTGTLYLHDGVTYVRVNAEQATEEVLGILAIATKQQITAELSDTTVVTPAKLGYWADYYKYVKGNVGSPYAYVDSWAGDDSIENDGADFSRPFLTIERAAVEAARRDIRTIFVAPGDYIVDNRAGVAVATEIVKTKVGPVNPLKLNGVVTSFSLSTLEVKTSAPLTLDINQQIYFVKEDQVIGWGLVTALTTNTITLRSLKGTVLEGASIQIAQSRAFNSLNGGIILAKGISLVGQGKVTLRPKYVPPVGSPRSSVFKLTAGGSVQNITLADSNLQITHHLLSLASFASKQDLNEEFYGLYSKASYLDDTTYSPSNSELLVNNNVAATITDCQITSNFGLCGLDFSSDGVDGFKFIIASNLVVISDQTDLNAFNSPGVYRTAWKHFAVKADGDMYIQVTGIVKSLPSTKLELNGAVVNIQGFSIVSFI